MIIGLGYKARSGKDTVGRYLVQKHGFTRVAFADKLKKAAAIIFGLDYDQCYGNEKEKMDDFWKETPRSILQKLGTECLRQGYADDVWIRALHRSILGLKVDAVNRGVVITDVRFTNEAEAVRNWGGFVWRIDRDSAGATGGVANHPSEVEMEAFKQWDAVLQNNGTIAELEQQVDRVLESCRLELHYE